MTHDPRFLGALLALAMAAPAVAAPARAPDGSTIYGYAADPAHTGIVDGRIGTRPRLLWQADVGIRSSLDGAIG